MSELSHPSGRDLPWHEPIREIGRALERDAGEGYRVITVPAPVRPAEALLGVPDAHEAEYWAEPDGRQHAGLGVALQLRAEGPGRFAEIARSAQTLFHDLGPAAHGLRLYGGFAFQVGRAASPDWSAFGEARFVLPSISYRSSAGGAELSLALSPAERAEPARRDRILNLAAAALDALLSEPESSKNEPFHHAEELDPPDPKFFALVQETCLAIERGELEKAVLARCLEFPLPPHSAAPRVLRRLRAIAPECVRFAFRIGPAVFLGATPERLLGKHGERFEAEAMAGSIRIGDVPIGRLMESPKDRAEHEIVVRELVRSLSPLASHLEHAPVPELHRLRHVAHLRTRVTGTLRASHHVLELVERLHPTPAVGGVPSERALSLIREREPVERGWYAGPVGFFDARGDGEFSVALRSGLLTRDKAALYAGAGIVRGSDAKSELSETRWKLSALLDALGAGG